ncbi:MAG TPA: sodium:glutamate symporter [Candidatus Hydrogenedentes bacterium]|nr:sodium:glutamate symporter [Candidatus Hydrogenedentota bacterium]HIJ74235.1 sodium:glutamate symporter [Candidatus Hydrogenedentota bacterium]
MAVVFSFTSLCLLLVLGKVLRLKIGLFQRLYLPASVLGGVAGLMVFQTVLGVGKFVLAYADPNAPTGLESVMTALVALQADATLGWGRLPGLLINIVFAALFLGVTIPPLKTIWQKSGPQLAYGQIVAWGQYVVGLGLALAVLAPFLKVPAFIGTIIPVGFEGGHGTAGGLKETFEFFGWAEGADFALASATAGIVSAIIVGMALINWAVRHGYTQKLKRIEDMPSSSISGVYAVDERPSAGKQTVSADSVDSLALHLALIGVAVFIGYFMKLGLVRVESLSDVLSEKKFLAGFPLFPLCMIGGLGVQLFLSRVARTDLIDHQLMQRLSGTAMDFLVVAAISTIRLPVILSGLAPFALLVVAGIAWNVFCVVWLARRLLPKGAWFERAITEMGQSMGVTATGLLLLRVVDPEHETDAVSAFGYKQLLHEPFMGGGLWTSIAVPLAITQGPVIVFAISLGAIAVWLVVWAGLFRHGAGES